jgi:hypothetical protein
VVRHFLTCEKHPELMTTYTIVGDRMDDPVPDGGRSSYSRYVRSWIRMPDSDPGIRARIRESP